MNSFELTNTFYNNINQNKIFFKIRGKNVNETHLYNIHYGIVKGSIKEDRKYEAIIDENYELPSIKIDQDELAILRIGDKIEFLIPETVPADWATDNHETERYDLKVLDNKKIQITLNKEIALKETLSIDDLK